MPNSPPNYIMTVDELLADPKLTAADKVIWLYIKHRQGKNSHAWPGEETISKGTGTSTRTIRRSIKRLQNSGRLAIERPIAQGKGAFNRYSTKRGTKCPPLADKGGQNGRSKGDKMADELETRELETIESRSFEVFWKSYPRKIKKKDAKKLWLKIKPSEQLFNKILIALEQQKKSKQWQAHRYIPYPTTWLNGERWNDEIAAPLKRDEKGEANGRKISRTYREDTQYKSAEQYPDCLKI